MIDNFVTEIVNALNQPSDLEQAMALASAIEKKIRAIVNEELAQEGKGKSQLGNEDPRFFQIGQRVRDSRNGKLATIVEGTFTKTSFEYDDGASYPNHFGTRKHMQLVIRGDMGEPLPAEPAALPEGVTRLWERNSNAGVITFSLPTKFLEREGSVIELSFMAGNPLHTGEITVQNSELEADGTTCDARLETIDQLIEMLQDARKEMAANNGR